MDKFELSVIVGDNVKKRYLFYLSWAFLGIFTYALILQPLLGFPELPGSVAAVSTSSFVLFSLVHGAYYLGKKNTAIFFLISSVISLIVEQVAVNTSILGKYHYTAAAGDLIGDVPIRIVLAWFMMIYPSYIMSNIIIGRVSSLRGIVMTALLAAMIMTSWDLAADPLLSGPEKNIWVWEDGGEYFGVPYLNYAGWMITTFIIYLIFGLYECGKERESSGLFVTFSPVAAYLIMMLRHLIKPFPPEVAIIVIFSMGLPVLIVFIKLAQEYGLLEGKEAGESS